MLGMLEPKDGLLFLGSDEIFDIDRLKDYLKFFQSSNYLSPRVPVLIGYHSETDALNPLL